MSADFRKVIRIGKKDKGNKTGSYSVFCEITYKNGRLSITGVEGPYRSGNCVGGCGQIQDSLRNSNMEFVQGWDKNKFVSFLNIWDEWHLNDMVAGSPKQEEFIKTHIDPKNRDYNTCVKKLSVAGLNPDKSFLKDGKPYAYGSSWLKKDVPEKVLEFLKSLPDSDITPAWV